MSKIAVDVALLPTEEMMDICIGLNNKEGSEYFSFLNKKDNLPHITLAMGVADEKDLLVIKSRLAEISKKYSSLNLEISEIYFQTNPDNKTSYGFNVKLTEELRNLQKEIMRELFSFFSYEVSLDMFYRDANETISEVSKTWVQNYYKKYYDPEKYHPHISLKCSKAEYDNFPIKFTASKLALCHLGNYCTCRKVLGLEDLK
jgi:hypothetical protein